jgi:hypothetical protein
VAGPRVAAALDRVTRVRSGDWLAR